MTTPAPLGGDAYLEEAILNETRKGQEELRKEAQAASQNMTEQIKTANMEAFNKTAVPAMQNISAAEIKKTRPLIEAEKDTHKATQEAMSKLAEKTEASNRKAVKDAAEEYATSKAGNALAASTDSALAKVIVEEKTTEAMRVEALEFEHGTLTAARESLQLAVEAEKAAKGLPPQEVQNVTRFVRELKEEADVLQADASKASQLSLQAGQVMQSAVVLNSNTLSTAKQLQATAAQALQLADDNARALGDLHARAQRVGIVDTAAAVSGR